MTNARHRKPADNTSTMKKIALATIVGTGAIAVPATFAGTASAATGTEWDKVAFCESSGPVAQGRNGLQIESATWADFGGLAYASNPAGATRDQQIQVAEKILASQGPGAWSTVTAFTGDTSQTPAGSATCATLSNSTYLSAENGTTSSSATGSNTGVSNTGGTLDPITGATVPKPKAGSPADLAVKYAINAISYRFPYVYGGNGPVDGGWDCSGLTSQAWKAGGVDFTSSARDSYTQEELPSIIRGATTVTSIGSLLPGDLVTYDGFDGGHVALYVGPIGPQGQDLIETNSRHTPGAVDWSFMDSRSGRGPSARTAMVRPAPFQAAASGTVTPTPTPTPKPTPTPTTPPVVTPPVTPPVSGGKYTVVSGDYLWKIAKNHYGDPLRWRDIYNANKAVIGSDPNLILPGQHLVLPK